MFSLLNKNCLSPLITSSVQLLYFNVNLFHESNVVEGLILSWEKQNLLEKNFSANLINARLSIESRTCFSLLLFFRCSLL